MWRLTEGEIEHEEEEGDGVSTAYDACGAQGQYRKRNLQILYIWVSTGPERELVMIIIAGLSETNSSVLYLLHLKFTYFGRIFAI